MEKLVAQRIGRPAIYQVMEYGCIKRFLLSDDKLLDVSIVSFMFTRDSRQPTIKSRVKIATEFPYQVTLPNKEEGKFLLPGKFEVKNGVYTYTEEEIC